MEFSPTLNHEEENELLLIKRVWNDDPIRGCAGDKWSESEYE